MSDGTPMNWRRGSGRSAPSVQIADDVGPGTVRWSPSPASAISAVPSGRVTSSASAPSSTATPAIPETDSLPPSRGDPSSTVTRTGSSRRENAAASPEIPPPTITTCGRAFVASMPSSLADAADCPVPEAGGPSGLPVVLLRPNKLP